MNEWKEVKLGDYMDVLSGYAFKSKDFLQIQTENSLPVIKIKNVANGDVNHNDVVYHLVNEKVKRHILSKGDILIAMTGNHPHAKTQVVGDVSKYKLNSKSLLNQRVGKFITESDIDLNYTYYLFKNKSTRNELANNASGSANQANISKKNILDLEILLPPLSEQKVIASVLSSLDDKIDLLHRQNETLEKMAETLFREWFMEEAEEEWEEMELQEVTDIAIGRTPPRKESEWFSTNSKDVKWISIKDLGNEGTFVFQTSECLTKQAIERFNIPIIPRNTVVLSFKMTVGRVAITTEDMLSNEAIAHFKFNEKTPFSKEYLYLFLKAFRYGTLGSTSSIVTAINSRIIKEILIPIPDNEIMNLFKLKTTPLFDKIFKNSKQIHTLSQLRDTLLPKLMSGEVGVEY